MATTASLNVGMRGMLRRGMSICDQISYDFYIEKYLWFMKLCFSSGSKYAPDISAWNALRDDVLRGFMKFPKEKNDMIRVSLKVQD